jgi:hypothetical protein
LGITFLRVKNTSSLILLLLTSIACNCQAQEIKWPVHYFDRGYNGAAIRQGYAVTKNGDTATGFIKLMPLGKFYHVLDTSTNEIRGLYYQIVAFMRIYDRGPGGPFTDYFNLSYKHRLWRLLAKSGDVCLYDDVLNGGPPHIILVTPYTRIKLYTGMGWFLHNGEMYNPGLLVRFINKRYKTSFTNDHFLSSGDFYAYILAKENERMKKL